MATYTTLQNNAFNFEVFEAGMATNARLDRATAKWQIAIESDTEATQLSFSDVRVIFSTTDGDTEEVVLGDFDAIGTAAGPIYFGDLLEFPDLPYVETTNELNSVAIVGTFSFKPDSATPAPNDEIEIAIRYNKTGTEADDVLTLGGANDPSGQSSKWVEYDGAAFFCPVVKQRETFIRFGPEKIKFHRFYTRVTPVCIPRI